jgi:uncharacterized protein (DUF1330 family)
MKIQHSMPLAMLAGIGIGAVAVQTLHAQPIATPVYYISEIDVTNVEAYTKEFVAKVQPLVKAAGGRSLAGGQKVTAIEGEPPKPRVVVQVWDSMDKFQAWRNSTEYKEVRKIGDKYAKFRSFVVEGLPQ